jgi:two-component system, NarL family, sensor histidine kinase DevS
MGNMEQQTLRHLLRAARHLTAERALDRALAGAVSVACEMTRARHGAIAVLGLDGTRIERLVTADTEQGMPAAAAAATPALQQEMIGRPVPIRRTQIAEPPSADRAAPQPAAMRSFLAVPIMIGTRVWGHLYLADANAGEFTEDDEQAALILSALVSSAIDHTELLDRLPPSSETARLELRRGEAIVAMARVLQPDAGMQEVAEVVAEEGQQFAEVRALVLFLPIGDQLEAVSAALDVPAPASGFSIPLQGALADPVFRGLRVVHLSGDPRPVELGLRRWLGADSALLVPLEFVGRAVGVLAAFDPRSGAPGFGPEDERLLRSFADAAATAIVASRLVQAESAERRAAERAREGGRLARELHDETLQGLGLLRLSLSSALQGETNEQLARSVESAIRDLDHEIDELRRLIDELRPAALQVLGLEAALRALADDAAVLGNLEVETDISLGGGPERLPAEIEHALYRTAQEALTNVVKHADASRVELDLASDTDSVELRVADNGRGIGARPGRIGFGLLAMRERVESVGGRFDLATSAGTGTTVRASFPAVGVGGRAQVPPTPDPLPG